MDSLSSNPLPEVSFIVPAAGMGLRMGGNVAKQYLLIEGKPILQLTLERLLSLQPGKIVLVVSEHDRNWASIEATEHCCVVTGGETRSDSVLNGLNALDGEATDWVMVHDCVRPCVRPGDINRLYRDLRLTPVGGLLGLPVLETLKKVSDEDKKTTQLLKTGAVKIKTDNRHVVSTILYPSSSRKPR